MSNKFTACLFFLIIFLLSSGCATIGENDSGFNPQVNGLNGHSRLPALKRAPSMQERGYVSFGLLVYEPAHAKIISVNSYFNVFLQLKNRIGEGDTVIALDDKPLEKSFLMAASALSITNLSSDRRLIDTLYATSRLTGEIYFPRSDDAISYLNQLKDKGMDAIIIVRSDYPGDYIYDGVVQLPACGFATYEGKNDIKAFSSFIVSVVDVDTGKIIKNASYIQAATQWLDSEKLSEAKSSPSPQFQEMLKNELLGLYGHNARHSLQTLKISNSKKIDSDQ